MKPSRNQGSLHLPLPLIIIVILTGAAVLTLLFFSFWQRLNHKVEVVLEDQFNQQQLMLARKIGDNIESYFDFLENALQGYAGLFQNTPRQDLDLDNALVERFARHQRLGILEVRRYDASGRGVQAFSTAAAPLPASSLTLPTPYLQWAREPAHRSRLLLSKTFVYSEPPWQGRRVMRFLTPLYSGPQQTFAGVLEFLIDPFFICERVTANVRSGRTGYAWIIDQDEILLAHYEKSFVGHKAIEVRLARNPKISFRGLPELQAALLAGKEGTTEYVSGWHRQKIGQITKLAAYIPVNFRGDLITGVTDLEDPAHNRWGVCVTAPVAEVSGQVSQVLHQEIFLAGIFIGLVILASVALIGTTLVFNKKLARQVELKTRELLESQEHLLHSERFAAVGEAAAYVSHEIKNPLMVIGGLAGQVARRLANDPAAQEKLGIIQGEVKHLESFLGDLRDFLRPVPPRRQEVNLNEIVQAVEALMSGAAEEKGLRLEDRLGPDLPRLQADPNRLRQVLVNFIKNAIEASDGGSRIVLATGSDHGWVWFSVQDSGKGMTPEVREKIFHPFFTTKEKGTGLGLAVIHKIVTDHHGLINLETAPGAGTTFTVKLPLEG